MPAFSRDLAPAAGVFTPWAGAPGVPERWRQQKFPLVCRIMRQKPELSETFRRWRSRWERMLTYVQGLGGEAVTSKEEYELLLERLRAAESTRYAEEPTRDGGAKLSHLVSPPAPMPARAVLDIAPPASLGAVAERERQLGASLPESLREVLTQFSEAVFFRWCDCVSDAPETSGGFRWSLEDLWIVPADTFEPFITWGHADQISFDLTSPQLGLWYDGPGDLILIELSGSGGVWYLDHEYDLLPRQAGRDFIDFVDRFTQLGWVITGAHDLDLYCDDSGLDLRSERAMELQRLFGFEDS